MASCGLCPPPPWAAQEGFLCLEGECPGAQNRCLALQGAERQKLTRADLHHQHTLLHRALQSWRTYQSRVRSVLQEVAARESQHKRQLLRGVLHRWRENTVARVDEAKKTSRASAHYRRTVCSKVLVQWREAVSVQIYYRQQEDCAVRKAQKVLDRGYLRIWFRRWWDRGQRAAQRRVQLERAVQHDCQRLLLQGMAGWKAHHLCCIRKRLVNRRREQQGTARALWFWSFSLQAKVMGAPHPTAPASPRSRLCLGGGQGEWWAQPREEPKQGELGLTSSPRRCGLHGWA